MGLQLSLIDNDYVVRAKTDINLKGSDDNVARFLRDINEELITGKTVFLKINGPESEPIVLEVTKFD